MPWQHGVYKIILDAKGAQIAGLEADKDRLQAELDRRNTPFWQKLFK